MPSAKTTTSAYPSAAPSPVADSDRDHSASSSSLLAPGENVWAVAQADRAVILIDAANYYGTLRAAMLQARHSIQIVGWDVDSRTPLVGPGGDADDGQPRLLGDFLEALVSARPGLGVRILLWDYPVFFAAEREPLPTLALRWKRPPQIDLCLDDSLPSGSSHHQKIVVIDDRLAFVGGIDLTIRRWDDGRHLADNPLRVDPAGKSYAPFHDVQVMMDGPAARKIAALVHARWQSATCEQPDVVEAADTPWPPGVAPDLRSVAVGIARTDPPPWHAPPGSDATAEAEQLFLDMVAGARQTIYIESQYLTYLPLAEAIAARLRAEPDFEAVFISPRSYHGNFERQAMLSGRADFIAILAAADAPDRWVMAAPRALDGPEPIDISVHSKVMIVDQHYLRVGSANLCNRSMGTDSECDVVIAAKDAADQDAITHIRDRLLAEHCGLTTAAFAAARQEHGSLAAAVRAVADIGTKLVPLSQQEDREQALLPLVQTVADPPQPLAQELSPLRRQARRIAAWARENAAILTVAGILTGLAGLSAAWAWSPLTTDDGMALLENWMTSRSNAWDPLIVIGAFVGAGLVAFPVVVLIIATTAFYGIWPGLLYAAAGAMCSAMTTYLLGRWLGQKFLRRMMGPRLNRVTQGFAKRGVLAVTLVRLLPIAPFSVINLVAGAIRVAPLDYAAGTLLGLMPGFAIMGLVGRQVMDVIRQPSLMGVSLLALLICASIGLSILLQMTLGSRRKDAA